MGLVSFVFPWCDVLRPWLPLSGRLYFPSQTHKLTPPPSHRGHFNYFQLGLYIKECRCNCVQAACEHTCSCLWAGRPELGLLGRMVSVCLVF